MSKNIRNLVSILINVTVDVVGVRISVTLSEQYEPNLNDSFPLIGKTNFRKGKVA